VFFAIYAYGVVLLRHQRLMTEVPGPHKVLKRTGDDYIATSHCRIRLTV